MNDYIFSSAAPKKKRKKAKAKTRKKNADCNKIAKYYKMTKDELIEKGKSRGIKMTKRMRKPKMIQLLVYGYCLPLSRMSKKSLVADAEDLGIFNPGVYTKGELIKIIGHRLKKL